MKVETIYKCPVCQSIRNSMAEAIACRNKHQPEQERWTYCEICGAGWNGSHYGPEVASQRARECELCHHEKNETESLGSWTFFHTGGRHGKYSHPKEVGVQISSNREFSENIDESEIK